MEIPDESTHNFANECENELKMKQAEGIETYAPFLANMMKKCQCEFLKLDSDKFDLRWKQFLTKRANGFNPRQRCWTANEFLHFPSLVILKTQSKTAFQEYMLRFRIDEAKGEEKEKTMIIQQVEKSKAQNEQNKEEE